MNRKLKESNSELLEKLEQEQKETQVISASMLDLEEEVRDKGFALERAQVLVKRLNDECERLVKDLSKTSSEIDTLKKENRGFERTALDSKKRMQDYDVMKRTEERLRDENSAMKNKLLEINELKNEEIRRLNVIIEEISKEKSNVEGAMEELEYKLNEIEKLSQERMDLFYHSSHKIQELEDMLRQKSEENERIVEEFTMTQKGRENEVDHWKRQAENVIRQLHNIQENEPHHSRARSQTNKIPLSSSMRILPKKKAAIRLLRSTSDNKENTSIDDLNEMNKECDITASSIFSLSQQLEEALIREKKLKIVIKNITENEGKHLKESIDHLKQEMSAFRSENERWIMRNEELEQRLFEMTSKSANLLNVIKDLKKIMNIKNQHSDEQTNTFNSIKNDLYSIIDLLKSELFMRDTCINTDLIPNSEKIVSTELSHAHNKIKMLEDELKEEKTQSLILSYELDKEKKTYFESMSEIDGFRKDLVRSKNDLWHIQTLLGLQEQQLERNLFDNHIEKEIPNFLRTFSTKSAGLSLAEQLDLDKISDPAKKCLEKIKDLLYSETKLIEIRDELRAIKEQSEFNITRLHDNIDLLEKELREKEITGEYERANSSDTIQQLKNIVAKEKEEKFRIRNHLEEQVIQLKREMAEVGTRLRNEENEKVMLEEEYIRVRKELENCDETINRQQNSLAHLEEFKHQSNKEIDNFRQINTQLAEELKIAKLKSFENRVSNLQEIIETQENTISHLQNQVKSLNNEKFQIERTLTTFRGQIPDREFDHSVSEFKDQIKFLKRENFELKNELSRVSYDNPFNHIRSKSEIEMRLNESMSSKQAYSDHIEQALTEKNETIAKLEEQLETFKNLPQNPSKASEINKIKEKKEQTKKSFEKRVKEFELILRYIEEKIGQIISGSTPSAGLEKLQHYVYEVTQKNITLDLWLKGLLYKLETFTQNAYLQGLRESNSYKEICKSLLEAAVTTDLPDLRNLLTDLNSKSSDLEKISQKLINVTTNTLKKQSGSSHEILNREAPLSESGVIIRSRTKIQDIEKSLAKKAENLEQISMKTEGLLVSS